MPNEATIGTHRPKKGYIAKPSGYCAGVHMAIKALVWIVKLFPKPVYCYHEIVHNRSVVKAFERAGVVFVESIDEVPKGAPVMLSAHGSAPEVIRDAGDRTELVVDAVCPLVVKVHHEVRRRAAQGYDIVLVGHQNHDEAIGTVARAGDRVILVEPETGLDDFMPTNPDKVALFAQTTLGMHEWAHIRDEASERFPSLETSRKSDLCYATTNRQEAVVGLTSECDIILVVGSENSSNTMALVRTALMHGVEAHRIDSAADIRPKWLAGKNAVGITAGASAPDWLVQDVIDLLDPPGGWEEVHHTEEGEYFPIPRGLRALLDSVFAAIRVGFSAGPGNRSHREVDRTTSASDALNALAKQ